MQKVTRQRGKAPARVVGLDIGSSAVRAVELGSGGRRAVVRLGQVGLPRDAVVDGEVRQPEVVGDALRRLWTSVGFSSRRVVAAVGGPRVIVREAEVAAMSAEDFRSAISFEAQDLIPIPVSSAALDFRILGAAPSTPSGAERMRILLAAAERGTVTGLVRALGAAGLQAVAIDVAPAASLRAARAAASLDGAALITLGAHVTNVAVPSRNGGLLSRTLAVGVDQLTGGVGVRLGIGHDEAETIKRFAGGVGGSAERAAALVGAEARPIVEEIVESLEYFAHHEGAEPVQRLLITGGGALTVGLPLALAEASGRPVALLDPFADREVPGDLAELAGSLAPFANVATGLALWGGAEEISLLPAEIAEARQRRQAIAVSTAAVVVAAAGLGGLWYHKHQQIAGVRHQAAVEQSSNSALQQESRSLASVSAFESAVSSRQQALAAAAHGLDWAALLADIQRGVPSGMSVTNYQLSTGVDTVATKSGATTAAAGGATGGASVTMSVLGDGGVDSVATWLRAMQQVPDLTDVWVGSATVQGTKTTFTCTATTTDRAPSVHHAWEASK